jgi:hypothetical protein
LAASRASGGVGAGRHICNCNDNTMEDAVPKIRQKLMVMALACELCRGAFQTQPALDDKSVRTGLLPRHGNG